MINCIIQARMSSKRLPGKVLKKINNKPLLEHLIDRVKLSKKIKKIIVTTSASKSDQAIVNFCKINKILYFCGNLRDVRKRYLNTIKEFPCKYFVRITGDSPLINPKIIDNFCELIGKKNFDLVTNVFPRSFPKGQTVEVLNTKVFQKYAPNFKAKRFKEHITEFFYKNGKKFSIKNIEYKKNLSHINMSVDNNNDLIKVAKILKKNIFLKKDLIKEYEEKY